VYYTHLAAQRLPHDLFAAIEAACRVVGDEHYQTVLESVCSDAVRGGDILDTFARLDTEIVKRLPEGEPSGSENITVTCLRGYVTSKANSSGKYFRNSGKIVCRVIDDCRIVCIITYVRPSEPDTRRLRESEVAPAKGKEKTMTAYHAIRVDAENNADSFWAGLRERLPHVAKSLERNDCAIVGEEIYGQLADLGAFDGDPSPLVDCGADGDMFADVAASRHEVIEA